MTVGGEKPEQPFKIITESEDIPKLSDAPRPSPLSAPVNPDPIYPLYKAIFDYSSENDEDLNFRKGDFLYILNRDEGDWWYAKAKHTGQEGYIPKNYIKKPRTPKPDVDISKCPLYLAKYDLSTTEDKYLSFKKGDLLYIINTDGGNWWYARSNAGQEGYIPNNYIVECNSLDTKRYKLHKLFYSMHACMVTAAVLYDHAYMGRYMFLDSQCLL